jgi:hypothetical protein
MIQPATACRISWKGIKVYTDRIRGQAALAGRCSIDYEQRIFRSLTGKARGPSTCACASQDRPSARLTFAL